MVSKSSVSSLLIVLAACQCWLPMLAQQKANPAPPTAQSAPKPAAQASPKQAPAIERYPLVSEMEKLMFGISHPDVPLEFRLDRLESNVFQRTYPNGDSNTRVNQLREVLIGDGTSKPLSQTPPPASSPGMPPMAPPAMQSQPPMQPPQGYAPGAGLPPPSPQFGAPRYPSDPPVATPAYPPQQGTYPPSSNANPAPPYQANPPIQGTAQPYADPYQSEDDPPQQQQQQVQHLTQMQFINDVEYKQRLTKEEAERYALLVINEQRAAVGASPLEWNHLAYKVADELIKDLRQRGGVSHHNLAHENPDVRYTKSGGSDAVTECLVAINATARPTITKGIVVQVLDQLYQRQDDRDAFISPHASEFAFALEWSDKQQRLLGCAEVVTKHGVIEKIPSTANVGDKIDIQGRLNEPYQFQKISVAWEGFTPDTAEPEEESEEAMPYFPPLDYAAWAKKSERDWSKAKRGLALVGMAAALAGAAFVPPVALAVPLIAATAGPGMPKAVSEIPIKGGVKVDGQDFSYKLPIDNNSKEGIYYVTVWATLDETTPPIAVSRRAILVKAPEGMPEDVKPVKTTHEKKSKKEAKAENKKHKNKKQIANDSEPEPAPKPVSTNSETEAAGNGGTVTQISPPASEPHPVTFDELIKKDANANDR